MPRGLTIEEVPIAECDPLLAAFLQASDHRIADQELRQLMEAEAGPVIGRLLQQKNRADPRANPARGHSEDIASAARELLIAQLLAIRTGERDTPIRDFRAYAASVAYSAWAQHLRTDKPQRSMLLNRIRYLLENRTQRAGFSLWESASGRKWCGYPQWASVADPEPTPKLERLINDPTSAVREAFGDRYWQRNELGALVVDLFTWLERPIELRDLVLVVSDLFEITDREDHLEVASEAGDEETVTARQTSPAEDLAWKEYLVWLWTETTRLSPQQAAAFLLHANVLREMELIGLVSIRTVAARAGLAAERLAALWQGLPLGDLAIAAELECTRQQVINLRRVARDKLGLAWKSWSNESIAAGNKRADFSSLVV